MSLIRKSSLWFVIVAVLLCSSCAPGVRSAPEILRKDIDPPKYSRLELEEWKLPNGLTVLFYPDEELPLVGGSLFMKGGSLWREANQVGLIEAMGGQMRQGGAGKYGADALDTKLEELSASIGTNFGGEYGVASFNGLSADFEEVFEVFADVVLRPRFEESRLSLWKEQSLEGIRRRKDDANTVAGIAFAQLLYGDSPYGRTILESDLARIQRLDLLRMHRKFARPNDALLAVTGKITRADLERQVERAFGSWEPRQETLPPPPAVTNTPAPGIYFVELPFTQSTIYLGQLGVPRLTPDFVAINAFNEIFGASGFTSRLMQRVREDLGLAYATYGAIQPGVVKGSNIIVAQTKSESTAQALVESLRVLKEMQQDLVREEELSEMKRSFQNSFVFRFDSPGEALSRAATLRLLNYPADYDETLVPKTLALTRDDILTTARSRWDLSQQVIVVVGNADAYTKLEAEIAQAPDVLAGYKLRRVGFDQRLTL